MKHSFPLWVLGECQARGLQGPGGRRDGWALGVCGADTGGPGSASRPGHWGSSSLPELLGIEASP